MLRSLRTKSYQETLSKKNFQNVYIYYLLFNICKFFNCFDSLREMSMPAKTTLKKTQKKSKNS